MSTTLNADGDESLTGDSNSGIAEDPPKAVSTNEFRALLYGPFIALVLFSFCVTPDDPLITLRYAYNFAHGHGLVFNLGERIEGFSSPLHLAVLTVLQWLPWGHALFKAKLASVVFGVLAVRAAGMLFREFELPPWALRLALIVGGSSFMMVLSASNGLETSLMCWLVTSFAVCLIRNPLGQRPVTTGLFAAGVVLVRPEGVLLVAAAGFVSLLMAPKAHRVKALLFAPIPIVALAILLIGRHLYFDSWFPNTYYAKSISLDIGVWRGILYLRDVLQLHATLSPSKFEASTPISLVLLVFQVALMVAAFWWDRSRRFFIVAALLLAQIIFILKAGGDWMKGGRFAAPVAPELLLLQVLGLLVVFRKLGHAVHNMEVWSSAVTALCCLGLVIACALPLLPERHPAWSTHGDFGDHSLVANGGYGDFSKLWADGPHMFACAKPGDTVAWSEMGYAGLGRLDVNYLDFRGLTDRKIARDTPTKLHYSGGVYDRNAYLPDSPVAKYIIEKRPMLFATFDFPREPSLYNGLYVFKSAGKYKDIKVTVYRRADVSCS